MASSRKDASGDQSPAQIDAPESSKVSVKVCPFWKDKPMLWFCQLESQFILNGISSDTTKYYSLIGNLRFKRD